jgi:hypothetical protein
LLGPLLFNGYSLLVTRDQVIMEKRIIADGSTHELHWPWSDVFRRLRLDYIFLQPGSINWIVLESRHLQVKDVPHLNHHAVLTRLKPVPA